MGPAVIAAFFAATAAPTFSHDIAPLVYRRCATCHHGNGVAPFPLLTYREVARHATQIATVTAKRYMPPWLPTAPRFQHELKLTPAEIALFAKWAAAGAPEGDPRATSKPPSFPEGWLLGKPDLEAGMPAPFHVPAEGLDVYQCFVIRAPSPRAHWVRALDIRPGNPKVVHHVILFQDISGTARQRDHGSGYPCFGTPGFLPARGLGGWTPGALPFVTPDGVPELLHANADLVLQVHYHPSGREETDQTRLAIYYTPTPPKRRMFDIPFTSTRINIPPGDSAYKVTDHFTVPVDLDAIGVIPHAHYVCRRMYAYAVLPDGTRRTLLLIPDWDFNWQGQYRYSTPIRLPEDTEIHMEFTYDNSTANPRNPNQPPAWVRYGPGSRDEMAGLHLQVVPVDPDDAEELDNALWGKMVRAMMQR